MMKRSCLSVLLCILAICAPASASPSSFVSVRDGKFQLNGKPLYYIGTNYWYGSLLGKEKNSRKGIDRLRKELDFLKRNGVTNLRLLAGAEGSGLLNGVMRVGPPLQPEQGKFDESVLDGLDLVDLTIRRWNTRRCRHTTPTSQGLTGGELPALEAPLWFNLLSVEKNPPENKSSAGFALFE